MNATEGRDWIGNPDGTLVYWQSEAEDARAKLARIAALCDEVEGAWGTRVGVYGASLPIAQVRAVLDGGAA